MCNCDCQHPEKLKGNPGDCSPERMKECHGDGSEHLCAPHCEGESERKD